MAVKRQPESSAGEISESAHNWFRQRVKHIEINMTETGQVLCLDSEWEEFCLAAMRATKLAVRDAGIPEDEIVNLFGRVILEEKSGGKEVIWNAELNRTRFQLIDGDLQGTLSRAEQLLYEPEGERVLEVAFRIYRAPSIN
jgi:hypothetical protein